MLRRNAKMGNVNNEMTEDVKNILGYLNEDDKRNTILM